MMRCHQCHAPVKPTAPDGDIRYVAPADGGSRIADLESKLGVATEARDGYKKQNEKMHDEKTAASSRIAALETGLAACVRDLRSSGHSEYQCVENADVLLAQKVG